MNDKIETVDEILNRLRAYDDIKRERDELQEKYDQICSQTLFEINKVCDERDKLRKECDQFRSLNESYAACWEEIRAALGESEQGDKTCDLDRVLKAIRERDKLREALREVLKVSEPTPVLTYQKMEDIASKALKETK